MLKVKMIPVLAKIASKIDVRPVIEKMKVLDIVQDGQKSFSDLSEEQKALLVFEISSAVLPQLGKIAADIPELVSLYRNIPLDEAGEVDFVPVMKEILADTGIVSFFGNALRRNAVQGSSAFSQPIMTSI